MTNARDNLDEIAEFVRQRWDGCRDWADDRFRSWVGWHVRHGRCLLARESGELTGVAFTRCVDGDKDAEMSYRDTDGEIVHVDLVVTRHVRAMKALFTLGWLEFGRSKKFLSWDRGKHGNRYVKKPLGQMARKLKMTHGQKLRTT